MKLTSIDRAYLAADAYEDRSREAAAVRRKDRIVPIGGKDYEVLDHVNTSSGYQGTAYRSVETNEVVIAHRGTEFNPLSKEFLRDVVRADGGMVAKGINVEAADAIAFTEKVLKHVTVMAESRGRSPPEVTVAAHSLGGTLAQITAHRFHLKGETFNAYGAAGLGYGIPQGGSDVVNHIDAADFVSAASRHYGAVRVYASQQDLSHLQQHDYGRSPLIANVPVPTPAVAAVERINALADTVLGPDPIQAALSAHGVNAVASSVSRRPNWAAHRC